MDAQVVQSMLILYLSDDKLDIASATLGTTLTAGQSIGIAILAGIVAKAACGPPFYAVSTERSVQLWFPRIKELVQKRGDGALGPRCKYATTIFSSVDPSLEAKRMGKVAEL